LVLSGFFIGNSLVIYTEIHPSFDASMCDNHENTNP
jgi:hypothetical protein